MPTRKNYKFPRTSIPKTDISNDTGPSMKIFVDNMKSIGKGAMAIPGVVAGAASSAVKTLTNKEKRDAAIGAVTEKIKNFEPSGANRGRKGSPRVRPSYLRNNK